MHLRCGKHEWTESGRISRVEPYTAEGRESYRFLVKPARTSKTWSGRGKQPLWFADAVKKRGVTAESLLIDGSTITTKAPAKAAKKAVKKATKKAVKKTATKKTAKA